MRPSARSLRNFMDSAPGMEKFTYTGSMRLMVVKRLESAVLPMRLPSDLVSLLVMPVMGASTRV